MEVKRTGLKSSEVLLDKMGACLNTIGMKMPLGNMKLKQSPLD